MQSCPLQGSTLPGQGSEAAGERPGFTVPTGSALWLVIFCSTLVCLVLSCSVLALTYSWS